VSLGGVKIACLISSSNDLPHRTLTQDLVIKSFVEFDVVILELDRLQPGIAPRELLLLPQGSEQK